MAYEYVWHTLPNVDEALRCVCLRWDIAEEQDYTTLLFQSAPSKRSVALERGTA